MSDFRIDLSGVRDLVEGLMADKCIIHRPVDDKNKVWNPETMVYDAAQPWVVFEGDCNIWSSKQGSYLVREGEVDQRIGTYFVEVMQDAPKPLPEDVITILEVNPEGNQQLVGMEIVVKGIDLYTYSVSQIVMGEIRERTPT